MEMILQKYLNQNLWGALLQSSHLAQPSTSVVQTCSQPLFFVLPKEPLSLLLGDREFCFSPIKFEISFNRAGRRYTLTYSAFFQDSTENKGSSRGVPPIIPTSSNSFPLLEPVGGSAPKFSSGAIEQLLVEDSTSTALLCAAQAAPPPAFRWNLHILFQRK